jgi:spermidine/putrescine ABC transporter ATP-binding subunit
MIAPGDGTTKAGPMAKAGGPSGAGTAIQDRSLRSLSGKASGIQLVELTRTYGSFGAVNGVNLDVAQGEFIALLGPSGSGKTTILMMVAGFTAPSSGDVRIGGRSIVGIPPEDREIGVVFQNYALFPHLRVEHNVSFPLEMRRLPRAEIAAAVAQALDLVGLAGLGQRYPHELSGGQQQRVALARALVFRPALLLMDEPLGALDKHLRQQMQLELRSLHRDLKTTILYVTHDQQEALALADRIAIMHQGRLVQVDSPGMLYREPGNRFVASFMGDCNFLPISRADRNGDSWEIDIAGYRGCVPGRPGQAAPGADHKLAVRPHLAQLRPQAGGDGLPAKVVDIVFMGETIEYVVRLLGDEKFIVREMCGAHDATIAPGTGVTVTWSWPDARLL